MSTKETEFHLGTEVRRRRESQGLTLEELGARSGLTPNYIGGVELGRRDPSLSTILALAKGLGVPAGELLGGSGQVAPASLEAGRLFESIDNDAKNAVLSLLHVLLDREPPKPRR